MMNQSTPKPIPIAPLKIIALENSKELANKINQLIVNARQEKLTEIGNYEKQLSYLGYGADNYLVRCHCPRFGSGESKAVIEEPLQGTDLYILADTVNHSIPFKMKSKETILSPDAHFQNLKRIIAACNGHPHRINIIMPFLYQGRQNERAKLESLDCAIALQELVRMGVSNIITFDANEPRVQNAIPTQGFDNFMTAYQMIQEMISAEPDLKIDLNNLMIISPNEAGMHRCIYYANVMGVNMGMFHKRKDYSTDVVSGNPAVYYEFLGTGPKNRDVLIVADMISSGEGLLEIAAELKKRKARKVFIAATYGLFTKGFAHFDSYYSKGIINKIFTTNLTYIPQELREKPYYYSVDISKYLALIIDTLNHDTSVNEILNPTSRIQELLH